MTPFKSLCVGFLTASLSSAAISASQLTVMGLSVGDSWAAARPKIQAACASLKGCDPAMQSNSPSAGDWYRLQLSGKVGDKECTRLEVDFVRRGRTFLVNEIALTHLCATDVSSIAAEEKLTARFGGHVAKKVQTFRTNDDKVVTSLLWGRKGLALEDVLSNERMQDTIPGVYLLTPKEGATYMFASIDSSKATGASSVVSLVLTHGSLTALRHELMVQAHTRAAISAPSAQTGS